MADGVYLTREAVMRVRKSEAIPRIGGSIFPDRGQMIIAQLNSIVIGIRVSHRGGVRDNALKRVQ
jgi:hypothetical protein